MLNTEAQTEKTRNAAVNFYKVKTETLRVVISSPSTKDHELDRIFNLSIPKKLQCMRDASK